MEHSTDFPDAFYRVTIKGFCVRDEKLLMIRESKNLSGGWELPGGGLDFGEDIHTGFKREVSEEMGLTVIKISEKPQYLWTHKHSSRNLRNMEWFYSLVIGYRVEFENLDFTKTDECEEIAFFTKEEVGELNIKGQMSELADTFNPEDFTTSF